MLYVGQKLYIAYVKMLFLYTDNKEIFDLTWLDWEILL